MGERGITRRRLIGTAAAGAAGAALPADALARRRHRTRRRRRHRRATPRSADVLVIGAGLAGLAAARSVVAAGRSAIVLEARGRVGGRTLNQPIGGGEVVEIGGQWVGPTQDALAALAKDVGVGTFKTYNDGNNVYYRNGVLLPYSTSGPLGPVPPDPTGSADAEQALVQIDNMAQQVPRDAPWTAPNAVELDSETAETWKQKNLATDNGKFLIDVAVEAVWAAEPRELSMLFVLFYTSAAGNESTPGTFERLVNTAGGAQESRFVGGSQLVSVRAARALGGRVVLNAPARRIVQSASGVTVYTDADSYSGKHAIVAMAPVLAGRLRYEPQLSAVRDQLMQRQPNGSVIKCEAIYDKPFWRSAGLTGQAVSDADPVRITFDNTPPGGSPGVLLGFIEGHAARVWGQRSASDRRRAVLGNFATYFGKDALKPTAYYEMNWSNETWTRGCYTGFMAPGTMLDYGPAIRAPEGRIHWAGTETSTLWAGYMDGAVRSGQRAAKEALAAL